MAKSLMVRPFLAFPPLLLSQFRLYIENSANATANLTANKKGEPFKFKLGAGEVIKGWDIGVAGMNVGQERRIVVPASLAYGSKKMGDIPANSELTFDLKLLSVN